ncbi:MAG: SDR family oxidoreductase [archaeon]|nr:MAG: SDR family oxidoreductase [archaeon]
MKLKNKVIVITGASDGIGKQISLRLAREGTRLALVARDEKRLKEVSEKAKELGAIDTKTYSCDVRQTKELEKTAKSIISDFNGIDVLVNDAGIWQKIMTVEKIEKEVVDEVIETNLTALIHITRMFLPNLKSRKEAAIINVVSKSGVVAQEGQSVYTASKYGARGFTEVLKADLRGTNVRVAGVYQSGTNTKMFEKAGEENVPTEKFTNPADLADVVAYMLSLPEKIWLHDVRVEY